MGELLDGLADVTEAVATGVALVGSVAAVLAGAFEIATHADDILVAYNKVICAANTAVFHDKGTNDLCREMFDHQLNSPTPANVGQLSLRAYRDQNHNLVFRPAAN